MGICRDCANAIEPWEGPSCAVCGLPFASGLITSGSLCALCRRNAYSFEVARSYGIYTHPLRDLILHLKFRRRERWGYQLGRYLALLAPTLEIVNHSPLIVPVPLHRSRKRERGYNQAELLAQGLRLELKKSMGSSAPRLATRVLTRRRPTPPQSGLRPDARRENVRGVFRVERPERIRGRSVLLVDDVMTTGATVSACAAALKQAGAQEVAVLTLARATPQFPDLHSFPPAVDDLHGART